MQLCYQSNSDRKIKHDIVDTKSETVFILRCIYKGISAGAYPSNYNSLELKISIAHSTAQIEGQMLHGITVTQLRGKYCSLCSCGRKFKAEVDLVWICRKYTENF